MSHGSFSSRWMSRPHDMTTHPRLFVPPLQLEEMDYDDLNEEQKKKLERKDEVRAEISRLTKLVYKIDYVYVRCRDNSLL
jgi:hypothetical protein